MRENVVEIKVLHLRLGWLPQSNTYCLKNVQHN